MVKITKWPIVKDIGYLLVNHQIKCPFVIITFRSQNISISLKILRKFFLVLRKFFFFLFFFKKVDIFVRKL